MSCGSIQVSRRSSVLPGVDSARSHLHSLVARKRGEREKSISRRLAVATSICVGARVLPVLVWVFGLRWVVGSRSHTASSGRNKLAAFCQELVSHEKGTHEQVSKMASTRVQSS